MINIELYNDADIPLFDIGSLAQSASWSTSRNQPDSIDVTIPLEAFKNFCADINELPGNFFIPWRTVLKVRDTQSGNYLASGYFTNALQKFSVSGSTVSIHADGFLNVFQKRRLTRFFDTPDDASNIFSDMLDDMQTGTNRNLGFSIGHTETVGTLSQKTFAGTIGKNAFQNMTTLAVATFDFRFNHDKTIDIYKTLGSTKPEIVLAYPGLITEASPPFDARNMVNSVTAFGSGFGGSDDSSQIAALADDTTSQLDYVLLEDYVLSNAQIEQTEVQQDADSYLANWKDPVRVCPITVDFNKDLRVIDVAVGDYVMVDLSAMDIFAEPARLKRIEKMEMTIDNLGAVSGVLSVI